MSDFTLPTNIKQIGSINDGLRVYVEDYVCTFLQQYAEAGGYSERLAFLVGRHLVIDGVPIVFVNGAIHGKHTEESEGFLRFSEKSIEYAAQMLDEHFNGLEIVGWMQSQPGYSTFLNQHYAAYHLRQFRKPYQVMLVSDPLERANTFFTMNPHALTPTERLMPLNGYFIYYDKNTAMHEYMLANKAMDYTAKVPNFIDIEPNIYVDDEKDAALTLPFDKDDDVYTESTPSNDDELVDEILRRPERYSQQRMQKKPASLPRRPMQLLGSLAAVLLVIVFVMGFELMRNADRIERMETEIHYLTMGYRNLLSQFHMGALAPAFAEQDFVVEPHADELDDTNTTASDGVHAGQLVTDSYQLPSPTEALPTDAPPAEVLPPPTLPPPQETQAPPPTTEATHTALIEVPLLHVIQPGESLISISIAFFGHGGRVADIIALNDIINPDLIVAGQTILIPRS